MSDSGALDQNEIERLLSGLGGGSGAPAPPASEGPAPAPAGGDAILSQDELHALFGGGAPAPPAPPPPAPPAMPYSAPSSPAAPFTNGGEGVPIGGGWATPVVAFDMGNDDEEEEGMPHGDLDYLAKKAEDSLRSIAASPMSLPIEVIEFQFPEFGGTVPSSEHTTLDQIGEVDLDVKVELGRTYMYIEDVLKLRRGSVVPLDKMAGETVDVYINGRLLARGEVLVMNENFCVRIAELLAGAIPME